MSDAYTHKGFTIVSDEQARKLAEICPPHKIIIECGAEVVAAANAVIEMSKAVERLAAPYTDRILDDPELKKLAGKYALEAHEKVRQLFAMSQWFGSVAVELGLAIYGSEYPDNAKAD